MFYLFAGWDYYPEGGASDFKAADEVLQNLLDKTTDMSEEWWHITGDDMTIVQQSGVGY